MLSPTDRFLPHFSLDTKNLALLYLSTAGFMILFDFGSGMVSSQGLPDPKFLVTLFLLALTLPLCAIHSPLFELLCIIIFLISAYTRLQQPLTSPVTGTYILIGVWLVRSWIIPELLLLLVTEIGLTAISPHPSLQITGAVFGSGVIIALRLVIRYFRLKTAKAGTQAKYSYRQTEQARREVGQTRREARHASSPIRRRLAIQLHDTIAEDSIHLTVNARQLSLRSTASAIELTALVKRAIATSERIKPTILQLDTGPGRANITETVSLVTKMLSTKNITLQNDVSENPDPQVTCQQALLARLVTREAATNILKYTPTDTTTSLGVTREPDGAITITISDIIGDSSVDIGTTGGFGLANLKHQTILHGGGLKYSHTPARWILWVAIPIGGKE